MTREELIAELKNRDYQLMKTNENKYSSHVKTETLSKENILRYSRQLILPEFGPKSQLILAKSSILIVGCGGLGCPAAIYLAAAGVGCLGLIDYDCIEISNLHRQILHTESEIGSLKVKSIAKSIKELNSNVSVTPIHALLTNTNALNIIKNYNIVLDCTDNVATRYLLNDSCVLLSKPLISGSALRFEGQLTIYNYKNGPCYRCLYPEPPPAETVTNCSDGGVLGAVPGLIGTLQALEAIKIVTGIGDSFTSKLLLFDAYSATFRCVKLRNKKLNCKICGSEPVIKELINYEQFCSAAATDKDSGLQLLSASDRILASDFKKILDNSSSHILLDVRLPVETEICALPDALNIPFKSLTKNTKRIEMVAAEKNTTDIICLCRRGNDSQKAVLILKSELPSHYKIRDITGGLLAWATYVDTNFPIY